MSRWQASAGLAGLLVVALAFLGAAPAVAGEYEVRVTDSGFEPADLTVKQGDTVVWTWVSGDHTVTSGESPNDQEAGLVLDEPVSRRNPTVRFTFTEIGVFDYFSRTAPDLRGKVTIQDGTPVDPKSWGYIKQLFERPA